MVFDRDANDPAAALHDLLGDFDRKAPPACDESNGWQLTSGLRRIPSGKIPADKIRDKTRATKVEPGLLCLNGTSAPLHFFPTISHYIAK